jgi:hypothetical protein
MYKERFSDHQIGSEQNEHSLNQSGQSTIKTDCSERDLIRLLGWYLEGYLEQNFCLKTTKMLWRLQDHNIDLLFYFKKSFFFLFFWDEGNCRSVWVLISKRWTCLDLDRLLTNFLEVQRWMKQLWTGELSYVT